MSHAATFTSTAEIESATLTTGATAVSNNDASGNASVRFGGQNSNLDSFFPIGVFVPPTYDFAKWKSRGINTMVNVPDGTEETDWTAQANQLGLHMIRRPAANPAGDKAQPLLLAWAQPDEPDGIGSQVPYTTVQSTYRGLKTIDPTRPVYLNVVGNLNQYDLKTGQSGDDWYKQYVAGSDMLSADTYPVNDGFGNDLGKIGRMVDHLRNLSDGKPVYAFIESGDIDTTDGNAVLNAGQLRAEIWEAIIHGVRGYWFFPEQITPSFKFDATPADVATEMTMQNQLVTSLAPILQGPINPANLHASVTAPLETAWRGTSINGYCLVLNLSSSTKRAQQITLSGFPKATSATVMNENRSIPINNGVISDDFAPYAVHVYHVQP